MKRIARHRAEVLFRWKRRHVSRRITQIIRLLEIAAERRHHAEGPLWYHLNRYQLAYGAFKRGRP